MHSEATEHGTAESQHQALLCFLTPALSALYGAIGDCSIQSECCVLHIYVYVHRPVTFQKTWMTIYCALAINCHLMICIRHYVTKMSNSLFWPSFLNSAFPPVTFSVYAKMFGFICQQIMYHCVFIFVTQRISCPQHLHRTSTEMVL